MIDKLNKALESFGLEIISDGISSTCFINYRVNELAVDGLEGEVGQEMKNLAKKLMGLMDKIKVAEKREWNSIAEELLQIRENCSEENLDIVDCVGLCLHIRVDEYKKGLSSGVFSAIAESDETFR